MGLPRRLGWAIRLSGLLFFPLLIWLGVDVGATVDIVKQANGPLVLVALALSLAGVLLRVWRWRIVAGVCGLQYAKYLDYLRLYFTGLFVGTAVPQLAAAFVPVLFISNEGRSWRRAAVSILLDRLLEMTLLLAFAVWAALYLFPLFPAVSLAILAAVGSVCLGGGGVLALGYAGRRRSGDSHCLRSLVSRFFNFTEFEQWDLTAKALIGSLGPVSLASLAILALQVSVAVSLASALDLQVPLAFLIATYSLVLVATSLPISVLGLGPREGVLVAVLTASSVTREEALALGVLLSIVVLAARLPGVVPWLWHHRASTLTATSADDLGLMQSD